MIGDWDTTLKKTMQKTSVYCVIAIFTNHISSSLFFKPLTKRKAKTRIFLGTTFNKVLER